MKLGRAPYYLLKDAFHAFRKKRYNEAYVILEELAACEPAHPYPYFLLAVVYLFANKLSQANVIIGNMETTYAGYMPTVQLKAFLAMKSAVSFEQALAFYINQIKLYPDDKTLRQAAAIIRANDNFAYLQKVAKLESFVDVYSPPQELSNAALWKNLPNASVAEKVNSEANIFYKKTTPQLAAENIFPMHRTFSAPAKSLQALSDFLRGKKFILPVCAAALLLLAALIFFAVIDRQPKQKRTAPELLQALNETEISGPSAGLINIISKQKTPEFYASTDVLLADFNRAKQLIKAGDVNKGVLILNRIGASNAAFTVKEKVNFLLSFVLDMDDRSYEPLSFEQLNAKPYLYSGYALSVSGMAANIKEKEDSRSFTLLADYNATGSFSGTLSIFYGRAKPEFTNGSMLSIKGVLVSANVGAMYLNAHKITLR